MVRWVLAGTVLIATVHGRAASPLQALQRMKVADGFEVKLFASEPDIRQPLTMTFDERGRMWVIQYLQYPAPAGLTAVKVDQYLRTKYNKVPDPPPRGPKGADRITICEDTDGDGRADQFKDFVAGLNLASGLALGHGGVFVAQPPYLLFYPDRDRNDVPDGDPEVLLAGFGMEDSHAFANSLTWGPDGWLYGAHGSTVTANIRGIEFQQGIWRYHPVTKKFELFAEGGGNTWGLDFDEHGNLIAGTNFGEQIGLHQVQGGYYVKGFAKHGPLHNPYTFGYFEHLPYTGFKGGHVTCGGIVYQGGSFPERFQGTYIAANLLANAVYWHVLERNGSSFKGHFGGELLTTDDIEFRPVDLTLGPDGAVYVADWCDKRATHVDSIDTWDRSNGRIYKIQKPGSRPDSPAAVGGLPAGRIDLARLSSEELVELLAQPNDWFRREARRSLGERRDRMAAPFLRKNIVDGNGDQLALQSLWALYASGGFTDELAIQLLRHRGEDIRAWAVRLLGDAGEVSPPIAEALASAAKTDTSCIVRNQLACTAKRLPDRQALPILRELLQRDEDVEDPQIPLLLWWAIEARAISSRHQVVELCSPRAMWKRPVCQKHLVERLARRYAAEGTDAGFATCAQLLSLAPTNVDVERLLKGMDLALAGRRLEKIPAAVQSWFADAWKREESRLTLIRLGLRLGTPEATDRALQLIQDENVAAVERAALIETLGEVGEARSVPVLLAGLAQSKPMALRSAALSALQRFPQPQVAHEVTRVYASLSPELRQKARNALCSRATWAEELLAAVDAGRIDPKEIGFDELRQIVSLRHSPLTEQVEQRWGKVRSGSDEEKQNTINRLRLVLKPSGAAGREGKGDETAGKLIYEPTCGICHRLFGEGSTIGPDLTGADRKNTELMLLSIVNPSAYIRPEYVSYEVTMKDDQQLTGLMAESSPTTVTILDRNNQRHLLARDQIKELTQSTVSLMPEGLLEGLMPQQLMDLFAYLQRDGPSSHPDSKSSPRQ